ncbi:outer membrane beta-barrel protein [Flavobacterium sp. DG1-102-2]|uniref:outer membrane beta-barrel protein n=1 Tax=Flavobacterium sp. DG1-102-2 TaxID=3081663 RepID=UPI002949727A|nr:outer membrane beta-barrel protein [Flavobacterium sp. DG1-102-2]MDV6168798.1 outer membrane beta-barrel protein [Flavobacterium sp. DG1-102-2]
MRNFFTLLVFLCISTAFGQSIVLKGKITDKDNFPLESATVYITSSKDSSIVNYTITDRKGNWELKSRKLTKPFFLKVSYVGLADHKEQAESLEADRDFGTIKLADISTELNELVIENEIPPIRVKKDTLEFDAASFKVRPDANVKTLLEQLPGVTVDDDGKIKVNGKEVTQVLVNGKPFFDKDGKIALENLPAEIINKVQVTDKKTKEEEYTGKDATGNNASINLTIDEDKNKGMFSRFMGGYGSDKRYEANALVNYFKGNRKISFLASSNNINTTGFTMNEVFDSMSGGRSNSLWVSGDGGFGINGTYFGGGRGITRTNIFGLTYGDQWFKGFDPNINYFYTSADTDNDSKSRSERFLPDNTNTTPGTQANRSIISESSSKSESFREAHNFGSEFEIKVDSTTTVYLAPKFSKSTGKSSSRSLSSTRNQDDKLLNESNGTNYSESDANTFNSELTVTKILNKRGRSVSLEFSSETKKEDEDGYTNSSTFFYDDPNEGDTRSDIRNQLVKNRQSRDYYRGNINFSEPIHDSLRITTGATYSAETSVQNRKGYRFNDITDNFSDIYNELTSYTKGFTTRITPYAGFSVDKKRFSFGASLGTVLINNNNFGSYMGTDYTVNRNYMLPWANANASIKLGKAHNLYLNYSYDAEMPSPNEILPIQDLSNPLYTTIGNENLSPNKSHSIYGSLYKYDYATMSGYSIYGNFSYDENKVGSFTDIDASAKQTTQYGNFTGTHNLWAGANWNRQIKTEGAHKYKINTSINGTYSFDKGITNGQAYDAKSYSITPKVGLSYDYGELLNVSPIYSFEYNETRYNNFNTNMQSRFVHKVGLQTTSYWPKNIVFGNDFTYTYNSNLGAGYKKDFFLWNTSLGYNILGSKVMVKVKVYDILNQNLGTQRYISPSSVTDMQNTVLKRYVMFSLSLKLDKFGTKKNDKNGDSQNRFWQF